MVILAALVFAAVSAFALRHAWVSGYNVGAAKGIAAMHDDFSSVLEQLSEEAADEVATAMERVLHQKLAAQYAERES